MESRHVASEILSRVIFIEILVESNLILWRHGHKPNFYDIYSCEELTSEPNDFAYEISNGFALTCDLLFQQITLNFNIAKVFVLHFCCEHTLNPTGS